MTLPSGSRRWPRRRQRSHRQSLSFAEVHLNLSARSLERSENGEATVGSSTSPSCWVAPSTRSPSGSAIWRTVLAYPGVSAKTDDQLLMFCIGPRQAAAVQGEGQQPIGRYGRPQRASALSSWSGRANTRSGTINRSAHNIVPSSAATMPTSIGSRVPTNPCSPQQRMDCRATSNETSSSCSFVRSDRRTDAPTPSMIE